MKTLTNYADLTKAVPESMFQLTYLAVRTLLAFRKLLVYCESGIQKATSQSYRQVSGSWT
jgi:hypothetical protein